MGNKLKIALIGYGKMGQIIEQKAIERGHEIVCKIDADATELDWAELYKCDVAIEFTSPESAIQNIKKCISKRIPVVVGTTGWYQEYQSIKEEVTAGNSAMISATNFSIGVNLCSHLCKILAQAMDSLPEYDVSIEETHHIHKLDAPSGTAITMAECIIKQLSRKDSWVLAENKTSDNQLAIQAIRKDDVPGTHILKYSSAIDDIEIKHTAHNRSGFAIGAVVAAEWLYGKKGVFTMSDLIGFN